MCLILHQRKGYTLPRTELITICTKNSDGFGLMYSHRGQLFTLRMVGTLSETLDAYYKYAAGRDCLLHWRMRTHGNVNIQNAHPFVLGESEVALMHNGVLDCGTPHEDMSDSYHTAEYLFKPIAESTPDLLFQPHFIEVMGGLIGTANKIVVMDRKGQVAIINRSGGVMHDGCWFSNTYAWNAPAHLTPKQLNWHHYYQRADWASPISPPIVQLPSPPIVQLPPATTMESLHKAVEKSQEAGALEWATSNPATARQLINEWFAVDSHTLSAERVAELLYDLGTSILTEVET